MDFPDETTTGNEKADSFDASTSNKTQNPDAGETSEKPIPADSSVESTKRKSPELSAVANSLIQLSAGITEKGKQYLAPQRNFGPGKRLSEILS